MSAGKVLPAGAVLPLPLSGDPLGVLNKVSGGCETQGAGGLPQGSAHGLDVLKLPPPPEDSGLHLDLQLC